MTVNTVLLAALVQATATGSFLYVSNDDAAPLITNGLAETNPAVVDAEGKIATRATQAGIDYKAPVADGPTSFGEAAAFTGTTQATAQPVNANPGHGIGNQAAAKTPVTFVRGMVAKAPKKERAERVGVETYPFSELVAPQADGQCDAFFVAATADKPKPHESLASAVSAATRRFSTVAGTEEYKDKKTGATKTRNRYNNERKFEIQAGTADGTPSGAPGAWILRTK